MCRDKFAYFSKIYYHTPPSGPWRTWCQKFENPPRYYWLWELSTTPRRPERYNCKEYTDSRLSGGNAEIETHFWNYLPNDTTNILKDLNIQQHRCENLKWRVSVNSLKRTSRLTTGRDSDSLPPGRSGDRIPVGGEMLHTFPDRPWGPPVLLYNGYRVSPLGKAAGDWRSPPTPSGAEVKERVQLTSPPPPRGFRGQV